MRPLSNTSRYLSAPAATDDDTEETVSFSDSSDEQPDPPVLQQLAKALLAWEPTLVTAYARLDQSLAAMAPFAAFLARLDEDVEKRTPLRDEIVAWLRTLVTDDTARDRAFHIAAAADDATTALASYRAMRAPAE